MRAGRASLIAIALVLACAGCSGVGGFHFATPPDTTAPATTSTTAAPNYTGAAEQQLTGLSTNPSAAIQPGKAQLNGTVIGPNGPVAGATVEAVRYVGDATSSLRVVSGPDGSWTMSNIKGGRLRVRAWMAPTLDMGVPQIFFLGATESRNVGLDLTPYNSQAISASANPSSAPVGDGINVAVLVQAQSVDSGGYVAYQPSPNVPVSLNTSGAAQSSEPTLTTDADGVATFTLTCGSDGNVTGSVSTASGATANLPYLTCYSLVAPSPTTSVPSSTTTTSLPGTGSTSSTAPPNPGGGGLLP